MERDQPQSNDVANQIKTPSPYIRAIVVGGVWFALVAAKIFTRHQGELPANASRIVGVLVIVWIVSALLIGAAASLWPKFGSWPAIGIGTLIGSFVVPYVMLVVAPQTPESRAVPKFNSTDEMMAYFATEATRWVKKDRNVDLDYSIDSIKVIEEELARISKDVNPTNPAPGTFGLASGYGAYVGEVLRRRDGGTWGVDHPAGGPRSYPLTLKNKTTLFPVGWCWKRLVNGEEDNVYLKAMMIGNGRTKAIPLD